MCLTRGISHIVVLRSIEQQHDVAGTHPTYAVLPVVSLDWVPVPVKCQWLYCWQCHRFHVQLAFGGALLGVVRYSMVFRWFPGA